MIKRFLCSALAGVMLCAPLVVSAAEVRHVHTCTVQTDILVSSVETGATAHEFLYSSVPGEGETYHTCNVTYITEKYALGCSVDGCDYTQGTYSKKWAYHSSCGLGYVPN